ncbi:MAG: hypothetical protein E6G97_19870 [Alphaproteobacteria bacterium]|nr:MAG: hypothetical protein E6G97_19870 [Alphaproteobacteria bacterium]
MAAFFDREQLLDALDEIGRAAIEAKTRLEIAVYGGSALMLAGNFRFATEDLDVAEIEKPWPEWLSRVIADLARRKGWSENWFNDAVMFHLSPLAKPHSDLVPYGTFPRLSAVVGLSICIPTARYMLALKLKALRIAETKGADDISDVANLLAVLGIKEVEPAIEVLAEFFPRTAQDADKQRFVLKRILSKGMSANAPSYPRRGD